jgi:hypothetical protein
VSERTSKLRRRSARGGVLWLACALWALALPVAAWSGGGTLQLPGPDAPPASARYIPAPDAPPVAASRVPAVVRTAAVPKPVKQAAPIKQTMVVRSTAPPEQQTAEPAAGRSTSPVRPSPAPTKKQQPARAAPEAASPVPNRQTRPEATTKPLRTAAPAVVRVGPAEQQHPPGLDRGMIALAGVLMGIAALGGAVLGVGIRHSFPVRS